MIFHFFSRNDDQSFQERDAAPREPNTNNKLWTYSPGGSTALFNFYHRWRAATDKITIRYDTVTMCHVATSPTATTLPQTQTKTT